MAEYRLQIMGSTIKQTSAIPHNQQGLQYSFSSLLKAPYNKGRFFFAIYRFCIWMFVQVFRVNNYRFSIWNNRKVFLSHHSLQSMWLMHNYWVDWEEYNLIKDIVNENDIVFDVGANIGLYSLWMSKFNPGGTVHSFEPDNNNYILLKKNIELNELNNSVRINKTGIADTLGFLYFTKSIDVQNHLTTEKMPDAVKIPVTTLDEYCNQNAIDKIRYIKIDIEGFELSALHGAQQLLSNGSIDVIQLEINNSLSNSGNSEDQLVSWLDSFGYYLTSYNVKENRLEKITFTQDRENYFAVRSVEVLNEQIKQHRFFN